MKLAQYIQGGSVEIVDGPVPERPEGGLLVQTEACGLCSGELMSWYLDRKAPHVLGHEVCGVVRESQDKRFPVGARVFAHHHAPCGQCEFCLRGSPVHCEQWRRTRLVPGGMAELFAVSAENLNDAHRVEGLRPRDAALIEPLACVVKSLWRVGYVVDEPAAVVGLGVMGLMHMLLMPGSIGYDISPSRVEWAKSIGLEARLTDEPGKASCVIVCPGSPEALNLGLSMCLPDARLSLFAPMPPGQPFQLDLERHYFQDLRLSCSYSCGPDDCLEALALLRQGLVRAEQVVSHFIELNDLPMAYHQMKTGQILKAMVEFKSSDPGD